MFVFFETIQTQKAKQYKQKTSPQSEKKKPSIQNSRLSCISLIRLWTTQSRSFAFRLG